MAYQKSVPTTPSQYSHYSLAAVQPFKVGLQFQISSHQAAALTEDWSAAADFCARPAANYSTILPLILLLLLDFHHSKIGPQLHEPKMTEVRMSASCRLQLQTSVQDQQQIIQQFFP
jgi:hypothetical protein